jgi:hypothetical protein
VRKLFFFVVLTSALYAQRAIQPTTTLAAETGNNTSASNSVSKFTNSHAASGNVSKVPMRNVFYAGSNTKVFAALMGWFGKGGHIQVGYNSQSPDQVRKQVEDMQSRGIDGAILAWYGKNSFENVTAQQLKQQAEAHPGFEFTIMIDHGALQWDSMGLSPTDAIINQLNYLADTYYSSPAYTKIQGRPLVLEFALEMHAIDWVRVRKSIRGNPMIIFRNPNGWTRALSDGAYAWDPAESTLDYINLFYSQSKRFPAQQTMGGISPSFNDSLATWSAKRFVDPRCGQTWLKKIGALNAHWSASNPLKLIQIATWNDYEEGSTIESGIDNCVEVHAEASGSTVSWRLAGNGDENTVSHFTVFVSTDGQNLMPVVDIPADARSLDLSNLGLEKGTYVAYVKAIGKPSLLNHMSEGAQVTVTGSAVAANGADYALSSSHTKVSVRADKPASIEVKLQPKNGFADSVSFSCSGLPSWAECEFSPNTIQAGANASALTNLVIRTTPLTAAAVPFGSLGGVMLFATVFGVCSTKRSRRLALVGSIAIVAVWTTACGGGGAGKTSSLNSAKIMVLATPAKKNLPIRTLDLDITRK